MNINKLLSYLEENKGRKVGTIIGIVLGLIYLIVGFWKMTLFAIIVALGYFIGSQLDHKEDVKQMIDHIIFDKFMRK